MIHSQLKRTHTVHPPPITSSAVGWTGAEWIQVHTDAHTHTHTLGCGSLASRPLYGFMIIIAMVCYYYYNLVYIGPTTHSLNYARQNEIYYAAYLIIYPCGPNITCWFPVNRWFDILSAVVVMMMTVPYKNERTMLYNTKHTHPNYELHTHKLYVCIHIIFTTAYHIMRANNQKQK